MAAAKAVAPDSPVNIALTAGSDKPSAVRLLAVASIFRDLASLQAEVKMEREATWRAG